jgi:hypothetical protein
MPNKKTTEDTPEEQADVAATIEEADVDSEAYTKEREEAAQRHLEESQERARQQFIFLGVPEPDIDIPDPEDRPIDGLSADEEAALETQNAIASEDYKPVTGEQYADEVFDSPDINPEAKEFQLPKSDAPDEFVGPEAHDQASATGVNPRSAATASDREGMEQESDIVAPVSENAEPVTRAESPSPETPDVLDD